MVKLVYLLQSLRAGWQELIGNIPKNEEGWDRALQLLKNEYGQDRSVFVALTEEIIGSLVVKGVRSYNIKQFYGTFCVNDETLKALKGYRKAESHVLPTLAELPGIKADLIRNDDDWENRSFDNLLREMQKCEKSVGTTELHSSTKKRKHFFSILKAFFVRHSSEYETSDNDQKVNRNI